MNVETQETEAKHGSAELLVRMANDIGNFFFRAETVREEAVSGQSHFEVLEQTHAPEAYGARRRRSR
jgi:hypothetical protein